VISPRPLASGVYYGGVLGDGSASAIYAAGTSLLSISGDLTSLAITPDERVLYYSVSTRVGTKVLDTTYRTTRADNKAPFDAGSVVNELAQPNTNPNGAGVAVSWVSGDDCIVYGSAWVPGRTSPTIVRARRGP
jgi:hypothetical protein